MAEKVIRKRGWVIERSYSYDFNDPGSVYHQQDEDFWIDGVTAEWEVRAKEPKVDWCMFIVHNQDVSIDDEGNITPKPTHMHAVIRFHEARSREAVQKDFCGSNIREENCQPVDPRKGGYLHALLYLTHHVKTAYAKEKTWYHHTNVHQHGARFLDLIKSDSELKKNAADVERTADEFIEKIMDGEIKLSAAKAEFKGLEGASALIRYRDSFEKAYAEYKNFKIQEMRIKSAKNEFKKTTTYISGPGASGKTVLADALAIDRFGEDDFYIVPSGGSKKLTMDFVDGYESETATIFNDIDPNEFQAESFYNMFEPNKWGITKSRNNNKPWISTHCYIAVHWNIGQFILRMLSGENSTMLYPNEQTANSLRMAFRRVEQVLHYTRDSAGQPVVLIGTLKDLPDDQTIMQAFSYSIDSSVSSLFYDEVGYVPYDPYAHVPTERMRMAKIINAVFDGDLSVAGFVKI